MLKRNDPILESILILLFLIYEKWNFSISITVSEISLEVKSKKESVVPITCTKNDEVLTFIKLSNIIPEIFQVILRYIYGGKISLEEYDIPDIIKIMIATKELGLQELIPYLESFLIENKTNWIEQNFDLIYQTCFENDSFLELQKCCKDLISKEPNKIFNSPNFSSIPEKLLTTLIQNDNLQMNEIQVWEHVIKWGLAQNPELPSDLASFSKEDFNILKNTLQRYIPFIKFRNLTSKEFLKKVKPYKKILPKELYNDLLEYFLDDDNDLIKRSEPRTVKENNIDSKIITSQHAELISKWIDRLENTDKLITSYKFKLLYRDSCDGNEFLNFDKFREICKNQPRTVIVTKVKDSNEVIGGYNPVEWKCEFYEATKDSFIFSFSNNSIENYILSRVNVKNEEYAIYCGGTNLGPAFDGDLTIYKYGPDVLEYKCQRESYEKLITSKNSDILEEFEVFQVE
ncbi:carbohydrate-binding module family 13 protein [Rhizophagus clarus]|uniref:Carbohydrate-binding module family 13 protein n=1 Tax=Rhizophagus clarus TaxID=94130 RepID=A0A8H3L7X8_9GLOM|nr:carbohydrate-binding module family 13 protein [Rhizophagus clarus]